MNIVFWFTVNGHWAVILGTFLGVIGSVYISYGIWSIRFLRELTQGFVFGIIGGATVIWGVGFFGLSLLFISSLFSGNRFVKVLTFSLHSLIGLLLFSATFGIVIGFIIGLKLNQAQRFEIPLKIATSARNIMLLLGLSFLPEALIDAKPSYLAGLVIGALIGYILYRVQQSVWTDQSKSYFFWLLFISSILGLFLALLLGILLNDPRIAIVGFIIGLLLGYTRGQPEKLARQPKIQIKVINQTYQVPISWARFVHGFIIGFVSGTLTFGITFGFFSMPTTGLEIGLIYGLAGGIAVGMMVGSTYGFGPKIIHGVVNLPTNRIGQIGIIMTLCGIILGALPSLFS